MGSERRSPKKRISTAGVVSVSPAGAPTADAMAGATSSAFATGDRSANRTPSGKPSATAAGRRRRSRGAGGADRLPGMTTNDILVPLHFHQGAGFRLAELRPGAVDAASRATLAIDT